MPCRMIRLAAKPTTMSEPTPPLPRREDDPQQAVTVTTPLSQFSTPSDTRPEGDSLRRRGVLPGESSLPFGTLPGGTPVEKMQQAGRYQILERIGRGGMATVFKAHDPTIGRDVAIKFLPASLCEGEDYRARFLQEARAAGGLSHPNIVIVHDVGEIEGRPYMAMELLSGISLAEELETAKTIPVRDTVVMGIQLARALDYAHAKGIVHRDIKPANIMRLAGSKTIKVTDFGIAHMDNANADSLRTRAGDVLGTPQYMSPEQTRGEKLDGRSDLFSAGIVLYQMVVGHRPFRGDGHQDRQRGGNADREVAHRRAQLAASCHRPLPGQEPGAALPDGCRAGRRTGQGAGRDRRGSP
jgi:hypothetical protein